MANAAASRGSPPCPAAWAFTNIKDPDVQILLADLGHMFIAEISMKNGIILIGRRQYLDNAEGTVTEPHVLGCVGRALVPIAGNVMVCVHENSVPTLYHYPCRCATKSSVPNWTKLLF